jgi:tight adherence protein B
VTTRRFAPLLTAFAVLLAVVAPAAAQEALDVRLVDSTLEADGTTSLVVTVDGPSIGDEGVPADAFAVRENGEAIEGLRVAPVVEEEEPPPSTVVILFDISGSAAGEPIAAARDAAIGLVETVVPQGVEVGLVPFGNAAEVAVEPTDQIDVLRAAIADLEAGGNTALYDAVVLGAELFADREGERSIVLFTDGGDNTSEASLEEAVAASVEAGAPLINVALITPDQDPEVLDQLAVGTDGRLLEVEDVGELEGAFEQVARSLTSQYVLRYDSDILGEELDLTVTVDHEGQFGELQAVLLNPRVEFEVEEALPEPTPVAPREVGLLGDPVVLAIALATAFLALLLLFGLLFVPRADRAASRTLRRGVTMISRGDSGRASADSGLAASAIGRAAVDLVSKAPRPEGYDERVQTDIDRAGWQLRSSEFTTIRVVATLAGFVLLWALSGRLWMGLLGAVAGAIGPAVFLSSAKSRRQAKFMKQLPDTLQLLAGTLKAGYGVLQAIDTVVKEVEDPTSTEFQRALTEARLGLPLEDSLGDMAERIDSDDFRWVVVAMNIQRQVGGNLAELLETVAATLRGREQVRRQISALSAEGRLSAIILIALPFVILGFLLMTNPAYLAPLLTNFLGWIMLGLVSVLMVIGVIWIRKMITIDV